MGPVDVVGNGSKKKGARCALFYATSVGNATAVDRPLIRLAISSPLPAATACIPIGEAIADRASQHALDGSSRSGR